jgi:uncharacterized protein RhaS with RHS repeats
VYDDVGNRTYFVFGSGSMSYQSNLLNQYTSLTNSGNTTNFVYDNNGNLVEDEKFQYKYDYNNRLVEVVRKISFESVEIETLDGSGQTITETQTLEIPEYPLSKYKYDSMGRRFEKEVLNSSGGIIENISYVYS